MVHTIWFGFLGTNKSLAGMAALQMRIAHPRLLRLLDLLRVLYHRDKLRNLNLHFGRFLALNYDFSQKGL
jgi:hypothetical protein